MAIKSFESYSAPFGEAIPADTPHAVSVSLPTLADVRRVFKDQDPVAIAGLQTIYPRFGEHPYVRRALDFFEQAGETTTVAVSSIAAAEQVSAAVSPDHMPNPAIWQQDSLAFLSWDSREPEPVAHIKRVMKRLGVAPSSRRAEDFLAANSLLERPFDEILSHRADDASVAGQLQQMYAPARPDVLLANSGMSAIQATVESLQAVRNPDKTSARDTWIVLGNLYHDTTDLLLDKSPAIKTRVLRNVTDLAALKEIIEAQGDRVTAVITEAVTNPLLEVPELEPVKAILGDIPLVVDVSTAGSAVVDVLPHADVIIESLTKFASGRGDLMMGAVILNQESEHVFGLRDTLPDRIERPYIRDVQRIGHELYDWRERASKTGSNVVALAEFFESNPAVRGVHWSGSERSRRAFSGIAHDALMHAGVITIETQSSLAPVYDALDLSKGLSFGTDFTLNTAYVHVTHPHEADDSQLEAMLAKRTGLSPRMLRVSVGTENINELTEKYRAALAG